MKHTPGPVETLARLAIQSACYEGDPDFRDAVDVVLDHPVYDAAPELLVVLETLVKWLDDSGLSHTKGGGFPPFTYGPTEYQVVKDARSSIHNATKE